MRKTTSKFLKLGAVFVCGIFLFGYMFSPVRRAERLFALTKKKVNPDELRDWAASLAKTKPGASITDTNELFSSLRGLDSAFEDISVLQSSRKATDPYVIIIYGGGFFHYGIRVGPSNYVDTGAPDLRELQWVPGIYFSREGRP